MPAMAARPSQVQRRHQIGVRGMTENVSSAVLPALHRPKTIALPNHDEQAALHDVEQISTTFNVMPNCATANAAPASGSNLTNTKPSAFLRCVLWCMTGSGLGLDSANESQFMGAPHLVLGCASEVGSGSSAQHLTDVLSFGCQASTVGAAQNVSAVRPLNKPNCPNPLTAPAPFAIVARGDMPFPQFVKKGSANGVGQTLGADRAAPAMSAGGTTGDGRSGFAAIAGCVEPADTAVAADARSVAAEVALTRVLTLMATLQREHEAEALRRVSPEAWGALVAMTAGVSSHV